MCRLLGYLGSPVPLEQLLYTPDHSLIAQSYQPREMTAGLLNADGFGIGWHHPQRQTEPYIYRNTLPIWNDVNLKSLSRYVESGSILANVRSATPGLAVDLSNCQPFQHALILGIHNGFIENFRQTLYRPLRDRLSDFAYQSIHGLTDSEHIFALLIDVLRTHPAISLREALKHTIATLTDLAQQHQVSFSANLVVSDGQQLVACRFANRDPVPTLYWLQNDPTLPQSVLVVSEPMFPGCWQSLPDRSLLTVTHDFKIHIDPL
jgi:ergothioneine biosynthesis protein EgtC